MYIQKYIITKRIGSKLGQISMDFYSETFQAKNAILDMIKFSELNIKCYG